MLGDLDLNVLQVLEHQSTFLSIKAPTFAWVTAGALLFISILLLLRLYLKIRKHSGEYQILRNEITKIDQQYLSGTQNGLPVQALKDLSDAFAKIGDFESLWQTYKSKLIRLRNQQGEFEYWASDGAETVFNDSDNTSRRINWGFYSAIPGIVTSLGLMITFIALLVALIDVKVESNRVLGLTQLIEGLSGKFVSSIAALLGATLYLFCEKKLQHKAKKEQLLVGRELGKSIPSLTSSQLLAKLHQDISEQTNSSKNFNSQLAPLLGQSLRESVGPTLERMTESIENLNELLRKSEAQRQESITGSLGTLLEKLEQSLSSSIDAMGQRFQETLSGNALGQFDRVSKSLTDTASLLEGMNSQFTNSQEALNSLISLARKSTGEQIETAREQMSQIAGILEGVSTRLNDTTGASIDRLKDTFSTVLLELTGKVTLMTEQMNQSVESNSKRAIDAASSVIHKSDDLSNQNFEKLTRLLDRYERQTSDVEQLSSMLEASLVGLKSTIVTQTDLNRSMQTFSQNVSLATSAVGRTVQDLQQSHSSLQRVNTAATENIQKLTNSVQEQEKLWRNVNMSMENYQKMFKLVEADAKGLLDEINAQVERNVDLTRNGFEELTLATDDHLTKITKQLGSTITDLSEYLEELTETLERLKPRL